MTKPGIGSSPRRREDQRLVTGAGTFGDDFTLPGQAFAAIARSPHAHAILRSIDTTKARGLPGVLAVLTAADYLADGLKPLAHSPFTVSPPDITLANRDGKPVFVAPHYPLALDRVRFVGEGVVLVVAETLAIAREAAELVEVEYEVLAASAEASTRPSPARCASGRTWIRTSRWTRKSGMRMPRKRHSRRRPTSSHRDKDTSRHRRPHGAQNRALRFTSRIPARSRCMRAAAGSFARRWISLTCSAWSRPRYAWSPRTSAAISARATTPIPNSRWWPGRRAVWDVR